MIVREIPQEDSFRTTESLHSLDASERPREKALRMGFGALTVPELFALILRTGTKGYNILEVCRELLRRNANSMRTLERRSLEEIRHIKGIGESKAIQVMAVMELIRRYDKESIPEKPVIKDSKDIYRLLLPEIGNLPHEEIWAVFLNRRNEVTKLFLASRGGTASSVFDIKIILKAALLERAEGIILAHNHPSGSLRPSIQDDTITKKLYEASRIMDIRVLDHVIVAQTGFYSYSDEGRMPPV